MNPELEQRIRHEPQTPADVSLGGVTLGIKDIMHARKIVLVAKGKNKAEMVKQMLLGPITTDIPASVLQLHPNCDILLDADAASLINV
jgi:glucosamine-6-phosphate deaminase